MQSIEIMKKKFSSKVVRSNASVKVTETTVSITRPLSPGEGAMLATVGGVMSARLPRLSLPQAYRASTERASKQAFLVFLISPRSE